MSNFIEKLRIRSVNQGVSTGQYHIGSSGAIHPSYSPVDGALIASVYMSDDDGFETVVRKAGEAFLEWRNWPAPKRGEVVRQIGNKLREYKAPLGKLVSYETGKSLQEGMGEVQEMIDICDFATGLSRQLYGLTMQSERPGHRMYEQWHPIGITGIISAFNFPVAVWSWNAMLSLVCGNTCIWKPSEKTPLCAIACQNLISDVLRQNNVPEGVICLLIGDKYIGGKMAADTRIPLISATGSTRMGKAVATAVASRLGKSLLELGGNNAIIISKDTDMDIAVIASVFGAVGTAGQRCTSTRRLIVHEAVYETFKKKLVSAYRQLKIGDPLNEENHVGPLIDTDAVKNYINAIKTCKQQGGNFIVEGAVLEGVAYSSGCYVQPCIAEVLPHYAIVHQETFAPILYIMKYKTMEEAITIQNSVPQGLSSAVMTLNLREAELFLSAAGSDCGIANVNIGTSGAEIGGAFGGEKETGGGRESGSDAWKNYMRRQTNTINWSARLPLAQGIVFNI
ncbi:aldehyde dehydrogenase family protein [Agriterribacter sp.]|uniref:L-piperidine-6-carboxylate dehydrogenase n=1 Tax=Agriterribacter sp. TaxID=2821509 RepID=UPI002C9C69E4|nr:aldehyde dehydrogenase family protein [Agriterribacter sp.]HTN06398.1 aldehyde dehydrogenase family protein [Agriterribacter sp.]